MTDTQLSPDRTHDAVATTTAPAEPTAGDVAAATHRFRAGTYDDALATATFELGPDVEVLEAHRIRRGGLGGFFATDLGVEITVAVRPADAADASADRSAEPSSDRAAELSSDRAAAARAGRDLGSGRHAGTAGGTSHELPVRPYLPEDMTAELTRPLDDTLAGQAYGMTDAGLQRLLDRVDRIEDQAPVTVADTTDRRDRFAELLADVARANQDPVESSPVAGAPPAEIDPAPEPGWFDDDVRDSDAVPAPAAGSRPATVDGSGMDVATWFDAAGLDTTGLDDASPDAGMFDDIELDAVAFDGAAFDSTGLGAAPFDDIGLDDTALDDIGLGAAPFDDSSTVLGGDESADRRPRLPASAPPATGRSAPSGFVSADPHVVAEDAADERDEAGADATAADELDGSRPMLASSPPSALEAAMGAVMSTTDPVPGNGDIAADGHIGPVAGEPVDADVAPALAPASAPPPAPAPAAMPVQPRFEPAATVVDSVLADTGSTGPAVVVPMTGPIAERRPIVPVPPRPAPMPTGSSPSATAPDRSPASTGGAEPVAAASEPALLAAAARQLLGRLGSIDADADTGAHELAGLRVAMTTPDGNRLEMSFDLGSRDEPQAAAGDD